MKLGSHPSSSADTLIESNMHVSIKTLMFYLVSTVNQSSHKRQRWYRNCVFPVLWHAYSFSFIVLHSFQESITLFQHLKKVSGWKTLGSLWTTLQILWWMSITQQDIRVLRWISITQQDIGVFWCPHTHPPATTSHPLKKTYNYQLQYHHSTYTVYTYFSVLIWLQIKPTISSNDYSSYFVEKAH